MSYIIHDEAKIMGPVVIGENSIIDSFVFIYVTQENTVRIGKRCHVASFVSISGGPVVLGDYSSIGPGSRLLAGSDDFLGSSLVGSAVPASYRKVKREQIILGKHAVVGANCVIMPGVTIGEGACVGANSLVLKDVPPWTIVAGSPAKFLKNRSSDKIIALTEKLENEKP